MIPEPERTGRLGGGGVGVKVDVTTRDCITVFREYQRQDPKYSLIWNK